MDNIATGDQSHAEMGLVLCTCSECIKKTHTDSSGKQVSGLWINPGTQRNHRRRMATKPETTSILEALVDDFNAKASIKDTEPEETSSESDSDYITGPNDPNLIKLVCK
ncbi:uncharacterized protein MELLADRAFT_109452 [Melampsora larici-populina 98AG31]|uniref:Uncharacterized protein n=1 Tax=Melampsora larici-populina (strain 98AG31 / pathotype 3-4-7) TaxID=747676 RepID=F4RWI4_MELLP|nr:uncharacterized protein MELLADRAFT_109452 [Melampsora larici-populina 98AG31]EGG03316.1 hypothetical protein MELLADRAFT_109452 [Melampsora larici-populina 98AG31]